MATRIPLRLVLRVSLAAVVVLASGCFSYRALISLEQNAHQNGAASTAEVGRAKAAVGHAVETLGMVADPRLERIARESRESAEIDNIVVGLFKTSAEREEWIEVRLVVDKQSWRFMVMVENIESPRASQLTRQVEAAVVAALREEFPDSDVRIDRKTVGPSLGP